MLLMYADAPSADCRVHSQKKLYSKEGWKVYVSGQPSLSHILTTDHRSCPSLVRSRQRHPAVWVCWHIDINV